MTTPRLVYVVDDSPDYRLIIKAVFARYLATYPLRFFESGDDLTYHLFRGLEYPSLIILDRHMPGRNGHRTLETIKQHPDWKIVPVVMISSQASPQEIEDCYRSGANSFLRKPVEFDSLRQLLESTCHYWLNLNLPID